LSNKLQLGTEIWRPGIKGGNRQPPIYSWFSPARNLMKPPFVWDFQLLWTVPARTTPEKGVFQRSGFPQIHLRPIYPQNAGFAPNIWPSSIILTRNLFI
jgi:hypothetical protein